MNEKENRKTFNTPRFTGTHGDAFAAVGLADLLSTIPGVSEVRIEETSLGFSISLKGLFAPEDAPTTPGYPFLKANEKTVVPKGVSDFVDYKVEKAKADRRRKLLQAKGKKPIGPDIEELLKQDELRPDWRLLQVLNTLQGDETSNRIHALIVEMKSDDFARTISNALATLGSGQPSGLDWPANSVQLFTPNAAKGYSRLKPDSTDRNDKTKEQWTDPFLEWLRYRGYFAEACPFFQGQKAENIRLLCPIPHNVRIDVLKQIAFELRTTQGVFGGAPKLDSLAVLKLAELLIRRSEEYHDAQTSALPGNSLFGRTPADIISGVYVTHYQSLGNAKAVSAMFILALPGWLAINDAKDAEAFLEILDEHQRVVRSLRDDHSDEIGLLIDYRRFLESRGEHSIELLVAFMARYGPLVVRGREQGRRVPQFRTDNLEKLIMQNAPGLRPILDDPGFKAVAAAVRSATVSAQAQKAMNRSDYREIRYDLIPELRRKSSLPGDHALVQTLAEFISLYNVENARRRELGKSAPRNITTEELEGLVALIDTHHAETVGPMLCAYGSCRVPRSTEEPEETDVHSPDTDAN